MAPVASSDTQESSAGTHQPTETSNATASTTTPPSPSSISSETNPFVQFRRFADSQISSLLQSVIGLPSLFERPSTTARWMVIQRDGDGREVYANGDTVTMRQRRELEKGWQRQQEQEAEDRAIDAEPEWKDMTRQCGDNVVAAGAESQVPSATMASLPNATESSKRNGGLLDWLGWDGSRKHEDRREGSPPSNSPSTISSTLFSVQEKNDSKSLDPFSGRTSETIGWLLTNEYSPIFLRGHIPKDIHAHGPSFYHALHHPHWPDLRAASSPDRFEDELRFRVPWCDAFEDLVSLQNTGQMVDRDEPTRTSSAQWLYDMIKRGSLGEIPGYRALGPDWALETARTVLPLAQSRRLQSFAPNRPPPLDPVAEIPDEDGGLDADPLLSAIEIIRTLANFDDDDVTDFLQYPKHGIQEFSDSRIQAAAKSIVNAGVLDELRRLGSTFDAQIIEHLFDDAVDSSPTHGSLMTPADLVAAAMRDDAEPRSEAHNTGSILDEPHIRATEKEKEKTVVAPEEDQKEPTPTVCQRRVHIQPSDQSPNEGEHADEPTTLSSSSSSTSTWSRWAVLEENPESIVSTMTTTERRTLPDGTVETRRVLKKRFADGREESSESIERQNSPRSAILPAVSKPAEKKTPSTTSQDKQTQTGVSENRRPRTNGWFWRE